MVPTGFIVLELRYVKAMLFKMLRHQVSVTLLHL